MQKISTKPSRQNRTSRQRPITPGALIRFRQSRSVPAAAAAGTLLLWKTGDTSTLENRGHFYFGKQGTFLLWANSYIIKQPPVENRSTSDYPLPISLIAKPRQPFPVVDNESPVHICADKSLLFEEYHCLIHTFARGAHQVGKVTLS